MDFRASHQGFFLLSGGVGGAARQARSKTPAMPPEDCDLLHAGLDEMRKNTNPFTGGINFDESWLNSMNSTSCSTSFYLSDQET